MINIKGCGLGLRSDFLLDVSSSDFQPDWWEVTPENWMHMPKVYEKAFEEAVFSRPTVAHGLSLSIGSVDGLNKKFIKQMKKFLDRYEIEYYSEHLSFSSMSGKQSYELLPVPMTKKMVQIISDRVKEVEDIIQRNLILENATYYYVPYAEMREVDFINEVLEKSGAKMLLDVNNVFVNSVNHSFKARTFMDELDISKVAYMHMAGHYDDEESGLKIDSHGMPVASRAWKLLEYTLKKINAPVMIERDNNIPPLSELEKEYLQMSDIVKAVQQGNKSA
ncbi:DUF692 domain-containing protein [Halarcobacter bivalviorum]|uniref:DUF692 domain-containing protein n=1 Tax=Halarcobacter bivalviorum TaxID=663364 RepID=A0AAX2A9D4_9BACT|nr:DUF692 domain-containing protein [Halarcobacter bivalviorum]AXH11149.1 DUF692 domain-containing protein [Halarcobacter bivalviorum]RXK09668.1 hypothetical protein CRV05_07995 [Halarcobacter bivalviorum]